MTPGQNSFFCPKRENELFFKVVGHYYLTGSGQRFVCINYLSTNNNYKMKTALKILAVDSQPLYAQGILNCLQNLPIVEQVDTCSTFDDTLNKLCNNQPHLVFLELNLNTSRYDGFAICREICHRHKNVFVAVLSRYNAAHLIKEARNCGAGAYIDKSACAVTLHTFLHNFYYQKIKHYYIKVAEHDLPKQTEYFKPDGFELKYLLTKREREVMQLIIEGLNHNEIGQALFISYETYKSHRTNILHKLGLKNEVELTRFALQNQLTNENFSVNRKHLVSPPVEQ